MSWAALLKDLRVVGRIAYAALPVAAEVASIVDPPVGVMLTGIVGSIQRAVLNAETKYPAQGSGAQKAEFVVSEFEAGLEIAREALANSGQALTYDGNALQAAIDAQTALLNAHAALQASFKTVPK